MAAPSPAPALVLDVGGLALLVTTLVADGWTVLGPVVRDGAVVPGPVHRLEDLPRGVGDEQRPGHYRLRERGDDAYFGWATAATSWKPVLFPSRHLLWRGTRTAAGFTVEQPDEPRPPLALLGVRSCDLAGIARHDRVLADRWGQRPAADPDYAARRAGLLVVAVTCGAPASTCFCASVGTGPSPDGGYDVALTEVLDDGGHRFVARAGSTAGQALLDRLPARTAEPDDLQAADQVLTAARRTMDAGRLCADGLPAVLDAEVEHPQWDDVAERCLACGNCTAVCPTCFCTSVQDVTDLSGDHTERWRVWDSCFSAGFSYVHGGPVRTSTASRYRQWMSHKLGTWQAQFDTSGCVGCGRCLAWCPVGIDITHEAAEIRAAARSPAARRAAAPAEAAP